jgi:tetratricopeptide (TPR) repeat protein
VLHGLMDAFTQAARWRDVTRVLELLAAQQAEPAMRAKYLYAGAALLRDQVSDLEGYGQWVLRVLEADPGHAKANKGYADFLEKKGAWKDLAKHLRNRLKALPKDATADERIGLFVSLGEVYETRLGDGKTALAAYEQAVRFTPPEREDAPETRQRRTKIMELALSFGDDELDKAIAQGHALLTGDPSDFATWHRLVELHQRRKQTDAATTLARTLAFLKQANEVEQALAAAAAEHEAQIKAVVTPELWRKALYHPLQDPRLTEIFAIVWPIVAAREGHTHAHHSITREERAKVSLKSSDNFARYLAYAAGVFDVPVPDYFPRPKEPGGLRIDALCDGEGDMRKVYPTIIAGRDTLREDSEVGLKFRAAAAISRVRPGHILASVLPTTASLRHVFFGAASLAGVEIPPDSTTEAERLAKHLRRFMSPAQVDQLGALARKVLDKGEPEVKAWVQGVAYTASRAGFVLCDSIEAAARVLTQQGDEGMAVPFKDRIRDLVAYSGGATYLKLRKDLGLTR